jgi:tetratricopeptide (TPR) repeat protein
MARLAAEHPDEAEPAIALARARQANGKSAEAAVGLEAALAAHPSPSLVAGLAQLYRTQNRPADAAELVQRMARTHRLVAGYALAADAELTAQKKPDEAIAALQDGVQACPRSEPLAVMLARRLAAAGRGEEAVKALQTFMERNGETSERVYELSHLYSRVGQDAQAEAALKRVLALLPTHTGASNDLGFYWADAGTHLDEAAGLIKKALDEEPGNGAYLDSMGWVRYKQGQFAEALTYLQKAVDTSEGESAEVIGHLGDTLYRTGRTLEAIERWRQAEALLEDEEGPLDKEQTALKEYLAKVLAAVDGGKAPEVTPTGQGGTPRAATR